MKIHQNKLAAQYQNSQVKRSRQKQKEDLPYNSMSKTMLLEQMTMKDEEIQKSRKAFITYAQSQNRKINEIRQQLQKQYAQSEVAVKYFQQINSTVLQIMRKLDFINQKQKKNPLGIVQQQSIIIKNSRFHDVDDNISLQQSDYNCFDQIAREALGYLGQLSKLIIKVADLNNDLRKQLSLIKKQLNILKSVKPSSHPPTPSPFKKKQNEQEIKNLKKQINQLVIQKQTWKQLLNLTELQKTNLMISINKALSQQMMKQFQNYTNSQLIQQIKKMQYRIQQLQIDKQKLYKKYKIQRQKDQKKFQFLLKQIKNIKLKKDQTAKKFIYS